MSAEIQTSTPSIPPGTQAPPGNWWDAYPVAQSSAPPITVQELASMMQDTARNDYAVIDVRRNDHSGGHVRGSSQVPAQTFHDNLPQFFEEYGQKEYVIFYCTSSRGRGPRCAGWYQDYLNEREETASKAYVLQGGIKAWLEQYRADKDLVDYDAEPEELAAEGPTLPTPTAG